jgi:hypothetical protein
MSEQDKLLARRVLEKKRLSSDQVDQLLLEADRTGRSFRDLALGRGLLSVQDFQAPPAKETPLQIKVLLGVGLSVFAIAVVLSTMQRRPQKPTAAEADLLDTAARAGQALAKARRAMAAAARQSPPPAAVLDEAIAGYSAYLREFPDDAAIVAERARAVQLRGRSEPAPGPK